MIWGGDNSKDELNDNEESEYDFWSNFTCPMEFTQKGMGELT